MIAFFAEVKRAKPTTLSSPPPSASCAVWSRACANSPNSAPPNSTSSASSRTPASSFSFDELLNLLVRQIDALAQDIAALLAADPLWRQLDRAFRTIKGVADRTVARLMAEMPEIGTLSHKAISKLADLAPLAQDSGCHRGKRVVRGGRASVREILFMVASVVGRYEPDFLPSVNACWPPASPPKVVRIALAHKLLIRLNAKAREVRT